MSTKKWLILAGLGMAVCVTTVAIVVVVGFICLGSIGVDRKLPVYTLDQIPSTHPGYRRTTITFGTSVYVNDYDEYGLQLQYPEPTNAIGRASFGGGKLCAIPGQKPTDYVAADMGSEMSAYVVFRNSQLPPFDWRHAGFQAMEYTGIIGRTEHKRTTDSVLIEEVVGALREGTPITTSALAAGSTSNLYGVYLFSNQLPGLIYCPDVYTDPAGPVYLAGSFVMEKADSRQWTQARWIPAGPLFTKWVQTP